MNSTMPSAVRSPQWYFARAAVTRTSSSSVLAITGKGVTTSSVEGDVVAGLRREHDLDRVRPKRAGRVRGSVPPAFERLGHTVVKDEAPLHPHPEHVHLGGVEAQVLAELARQPTPIRWSPHVANPPGVVTLSEASNRGRLAIESQRSANGAGLLIVVRVHHCGEGNERAKRSAERVQSVPRASAPDQIPHRTHANASLLVVQGCVQGRDLQLELQVPRRRFGIERAV